MYVAQGDFSPIRKSECGISRAKYNAHHNKIR